jgi:hypothetical protein
VLGKRKRLFDGGTAPADLEVVSSQTKSTGVIMATYWSGAEIKFGSLPAGVPGEAGVGRRAAQGTERNPIQPAAALDREAAVRRLAAPYRGWPPRPGPARE